MEINDHRIWLLCRFITEEEMNGAVICGEFAKFLESCGIDSGAKCLDTTRDELCNECPFYEVENISEWVELKKERSEIL